MLRQSKGELLEQEKLLEDMQHLAHQVRVLRCARVDKPVLSLRPNNPTAPSHLQSSKNKRGVFKKERTKAIQTVVGESQLVLYSVANPIPDPHADADADAGMGRETSHAASTAGLAVAVGDGALSTLALTPTAAGDTRTGGTGASSPGRFLASTSASATYRTTNVGRYQYRRLKDLPPYVPPRPSAHSPRNRRAFIRRLLRDGRPGGEGRGAAATQHGALSDADFEARGGYTPEQIAEMVDRYVALRPPMTLPPRPMTRRELVPLIGRARNSFYLCPHRVPLTRAHSVRT